MNAEQFETLITEAFNRRLELTRRKSHDYAGVDVLSNFKRVAKVCRVWRVDVTRPSGCAEFLAVLKLDHYFNLKRQGKTPRNESLQDTFDDLQKYVDLLNAILVEGAS